MFDIRSTVVVGQGLSQGMTDEFDHIVRKLLQAHGQTVH